MNKVYTSSQVGGFQRGGPRAGEACLYGNSGDWQLSHKTLFLVTSPKVRGRIQTPKQDTESALK